MEFKHRVAVDNESVRERLARLPIGLILFFVLIIALSYYFDGRANSVRAHTTDPIESNR